MARSKKDELKEQLYKLIDSIDDEGVLKVLNEEVVPYVVEGRGQAEDALTDEQIKEIEDGLKDIEQGKTVSWEQLKKEMKEWRLK